MEEQIKRCLLDEGFDLAGIASIEPLEEDRVRLQRWVDSGCAGEMEYLKQQISSRCDPRSLLLGAASVIVAGAAYPPHSQKEGPVAAFALYRDYHLAFKEALERGVIAIKDKAPSAEFVTAVDSSPILERALAIKAGLGGIGFSTNLIHPDHGPYLMLGLILTTLKLIPDQTAFDPGCESCKECLNACPTGALKAPYLLDARSCISYLTIEKKGPFSEKEAKALGGWAFGCDLCLRACPHGRTQGKGQLFDPIFSGDLKTLLDQCEKGFKKRFKNSSFFRTGKSRMIRNILCAAKNRKLGWAAHRAKPHLEGGTVASRSAARRAQDPI